MKKRTRWILIGAAALLLLIVAVISMSSLGLEVETIRIGRDTLRVAVTEEGRTRVLERYVVAAPVSGRLTRIPLKEGDDVRSGMLVAQIFPTPESPRNVGVVRAQIIGAEAQRRASAARVVDAEVQAEQAAREEQRYRSLLQDSVVSRQEYEQFQLASNSARQRVAAARSSLRAAEADVAAHRAALVGSNPQSATGPAVQVYAPNTGRVLRLLEESERVILAGTPLVEIGDAEGLEIVIDVLSEDAVQINPSAPVLIEAWGGEETLHGEVRLVEPAAFTEVSALGVEEQRVNVIVDLFDAPPNLGAGYRVEAKIVTWVAADALTVPTNALFQENGTWTVFVVESGRAARRTVRIGSRSAESAEVLDGLEEGDKVILFPSDLVDDGVKVNASDEY